MPHHELLHEVVQEDLSVLFNGAGNLEDSHASRLHRDIVCVARERVQSQARRHELKAVDQEKCFLWNAPQTALEVVDLALEEGRLKSLDLFLYPLRRGLLLLDGIEKGSGLSQLGVAVRRRVLGHEFGEHIHLDR